MRSQKITGIILKRHDVGEADRIITVFTKEEGRVKIKAKGVRKTASKRASHIEPFNHVTLTVHIGSFMPILTEAATIYAYTGLKNDLSRVGLAYHICELIDSLCPEGQENSQVFFLLQQILHDLEMKTTEIGNKIHEFEISLLKTLGFLPQNQQLVGAQASYFIESILERKLKTRQILPYLLADFH